jgi:putative ABC transport system permease protein
LTQLKAAYHLLRLLSLRHLRATPGQALRTMTAVMVGVGALLAVQIVNRSIAGAFDEGLRQAAGRTDLVVRGGETGFPESTLELVRRVPGIEAAVPRLESSALAEGSGGEVLTVLGVDITEEGRVRRYATDENSDKVLDDPLAFLNQPDSIIVTRPYADRHHLALEQPIELDTTNGRRTFVVRGLLAPRGPAVAFGGALAVMDYQAAQVAFGKEGRLDAVDVVAAPGTDVPTLADALRAALGPGLDVERPEARNAEMEIATRSIRYVLLLFSSLTAIIGMFLLYNATSMTVAQRGRELAILRALGVRRGETIRQVLLEAGIVGGIGALLGVPFGLLLARLLLRPIAATMSTAASVEMSQAGTLSMGPWAVWAAVALGLVTTVLAAWLPARQASRFQPTAAARKGAVVALRQSALAPAWWGAACFATGALLAGAAVQLRMGGLGPCADLAFIIGSVLLGPTLVRLIAPLLVRITAPTGPIGHLAVLNVTTNVERSAFTAAPLMVAVAFVVIVGSALGSFRRSIVEWIDNATPLDLQVASGSQDLTRNILLPDSLGDRLAGLPGVATVHRFRLVHVLYRGRRIAVESFDNIVDDPVRCCVRFRMGDPIEGYRQLALGEAVVVSENFADKMGTRPGDELTLPTPSGARTLRVVAVVRNFNSDQGTVVMARRLFVSLFGDTRVDQFLVRVAPGADRDAVRAAIVSGFGERFRLIIFTNAELRHDIMARIDGAFAPTVAIFVLAVLVGCIGITNALYVSVAERVREIGVLRSLGLRRRDVTRLVVAEAGASGLLGAILGVGLGVLLSYLWVAVHLRYILGWVIDYHLAVGGTALGVAIALFTAPLAGWRPARAAAALAPVTALAQE